MAYRSDVRIITSRDGYDELSKYLKKYIKDNKLDDSYNLLKKTDINYISDNGCYLGWNCVKWYENDYKDVIGIMNGLQHLRENDYSYRYGRLGESFEDFEESDYDSEKEYDKYEEYLEYPTVARYFDDDYVISMIDKNLNTEKEL